MAEEDPLAEFLMQRLAESTGKASSSSIMGEIEPTTLVYLNLSKKSGMSPREAEIRYTLSRPLQAQLTPGEALQRRALEEELKALSGGTGDRTMEYQEARLLPTEWSGKEMSEFVNKGILNNIPGFEPGMGLPEIQRAWDKILQDSIMLSAKGGMGGKKYTPWDVMDTYGKPKQFGTYVQDGWEYDLSTGQRIAYKGPKSRTKKTRNVDLSSVEEVRVIATQALREVLGRAPTNEEVAQFRASINTLEGSRPQVTTTTEQLTADLATGTVTPTETSSTTTGGVSQADIQETILSSVEGSDEAGKYQAGTTYFNALLGLLGG